MSTVKIAVVAHIFYIDIWVEMEARLRQIGEPYDLYVSTTTNMLELVSKHVICTHPNAKIHSFENRGRDLGPLIALLDLYHLEDYELILKLHTKKSPHISTSLSDGGKAWRDSLLNGLLPVGNTPALIRDLRSQARVGLAGPASCLRSVEASFYDSATRSSFDALMRMIPEVGPIGNARFVAGTMFWIKGAVIAELRKLSLSHSDFPEELGQLDGTLAHALERFFPFLARKSGLTTAALQTLDPATWIGSREVLPHERESLLDFFISAKPQQKVIFVIDQADKSFDHVTLTESSIRRAFPFSQGISLFTSSSIKLASFVADLNEISLSGKFQWLVIVRAGEILTASGLQMVLQGIIGAPECHAVYADEMLREHGGRLSVLNRTDFNYDFLLSSPWAMSPHWFFNCDAVRRVGGFRLDYADALELDLQLRLIEAGGFHVIGHVPEPLLITEEKAFIGSDNEARAIQQHLCRRGYENARLSAMPARLYRVVYGHVETPLVTILVSANARLPVLRRCIESMLEKLSYQNYEIVLIKSGSEDQSVLAWLSGIQGLQSLRIRVVDVGQQRSLAAGYQSASGYARGDYLLFIRPETATFDSNWLSEMMNHAQRPEVGVVGPKIINAENAIYSAGLILGLNGVAESAFYGESATIPGYMNRLFVDQNYTALSGACMLVSKSIFDQIGGFDADKFPDKYFDIDFCIRVVAAGFMNVWSAHAKVFISDDLIRERAAESRTLAHTVDEVDALYARWMPVIANDPAYNRNCSLRLSSFDLDSLNLSWQPLSWRPAPFVLAQPSDSFGCGQYRVIRPFRAMRDLGLVDGLLSTQLYFPAEVARIAPDIIVRQRQLHETQVRSMRENKRYSRAFKIFELDDYLLNLPATNSVKKHLPADLAKNLRQAISLVDRLVVSTPGLANAMSDFHSDIHVVELNLPTDWWGNLDAYRRVGRRPRVGWAGGVGHEGDLAVIADVVRALAQEVDWVFMGMRPAGVESLISEFHPGVSIDQYPQKLASLNLDLAIAPLEQNLFNACKSNLRLLEYGACGFPVVCSDLPSYRESGLPVTLVKNRFSDWVDAIRSYTHDLDAAAKEGDALRQAVKDHWMLEGENLQKWLKAWTP